MYLRGEASPPPRLPLTLDSSTNSSELGRLFLQCDLHLTCYGGSQFLWEHIRSLPFFQTRCLSLPYFFLPKTVSLAGAEVTSSGFFLPIF